MNTPLKPCPCGNHKISTRPSSSVEDQWCAWCYTCRVGIYSDTKEKTIAAWNTRSNTPESSAAQGAMGDSFIEWVKQNSPVTDLVSVHHMHMAWCAALAQPPDATAQHSLSDTGESERLADLSLKPVDLTDEQIATGGYDAITLLANRFWSIHTKEIQEMGISRAEFYEREMRALLANTAQGKTEQKSRKGFWDVYEPMNHKRIYVTVFNSLEAASYAENGYLVIEQTSAAKKG